MEDQDRVVVCATALGEAGSRVLVVPWGEVRSANGNFVLDAESALAVVAAFQAQGTDLPVDYEHQTLGGAYASPNGEAPAAGWIKALRAVAPGETLDGEPVEPGLWAEVEWTEAAREKLAAKAYRYLSPVVLIRRSDRRVVGLHSAGLTNKPAIPGMRAIVNAAASAVAVSEAVEVLRAKLGLGETSGPEEVLAAACGRIEALSRQQVEREASERVSAALRDGKLAPAQREWAMRLALKDAAAFDEWAATAPVVVALGRTALAESGAGGGGAERVAASARAEYRAEPVLATLTSEEAWVRLALRERGGEGNC